MKKISYLLVTCLLLACYHSHAQQTNAVSTLTSSGLAPVNGLKIYYEVHGSGEPIVLLHGAYMTIDMNWGTYIPELAKTRKVIAIELQGHGHTADNERPYSFTALASDVAGVMKHLKIDSADIWGYSFGATVAFQFAIDYPEMVKKLIITSSAFKQEGWMPDVREAFKHFEASFFDQTPLMPAYKSVAPDTAHWHVFVNKMIAFGKQDFNLGDEKIKNIKAPVLLIYGDNDGVDLAHVKSTYTLLGGGVIGDMVGLPKSQLAILPGKTHVSLIMDTVKILDVVKPFVGIK